jgi:hypothetical protein
MLVSKVVALDVPGSLDGARRRTETSLLSPRCKHVLFLSYFTIIFSLTLRTLCLFKFLLV